MLNNRHLQGFVAVGQYRRVRLAAVAAVILAFLANTATSDENNDLSDAGSMHTAFLQLPDGSFQPIPYSNVGGLAVTQSDIVLGTHADVQRQSAYNLTRQLDQLDYKTLGRQKPDMEDLRVSPPEEITSPLSYAIGPGAAGRKLWPGGKVPFEFDASIVDEDLKNAIITAAKAWNRHGIVQIKPIDQFAPSEISAIQPLRVYSTSTLKNDDGSPVDPERLRCFAGIGYDNRPPHGERKGNYMYLSNKCRTGTIIHEFGHTLGLRHEHLRGDRDTFMDVRLDLIAVKHRHNYEKLDDGRTFDLAYDPCSIMHYGDSVKQEWTTTGRKETWFTWKPAGQAALDACRKAMSEASCANDAPGQRCAYSDIDIEFVRRLYQ